MQAIVKFVNGDYKNMKAVENTIRYVSRNGGGTFGGIRCSSTDIELAIQEFLMVKRVYGKTKGRQVMHMIVSFDECCWPDYYLKLFAERCILFLAERYQVFYGIHRETDNVHIHYILNTVSFVDGVKYSEGPRIINYFASSVQLTMRQYTPA